MQELDNISSGQYADSLMVKVQSNFNKVRNAINSLEQSGSSGGGSGSSSPVNYPKPLNHATPTFLYDNTFTKMKVLAIGNSYTKCSTIAFPTIATLMDMTSYNLQTYGTGGASLETTLRTIRKGTGGGANAYYANYGDDGSSPHQSSPSSYLNALKKDWDVIIFQQNSDNVDNFSTYNPWLDALIEAARRYCTNPRVRIGWNMIWDKKHGTQSSQRYDIISIAERLLSFYDIDLVVPTGTAFENAWANGLTVALDNSGHTNNAAAEYLAAATWYQAMFSKFNRTSTGESSDGETTFHEIDSIDPTGEQSWTGGYLSNASRTITRTEAILAAKCAKAACDDMWNVTLIS